MASSKDLDYAALLGVDEDACQKEIETHYAAVSGFLNSDQVPAQLKEWAARQVGLVEEAYAALLDPDRRAASEAEDETDAEPEGGDGAPPSAADAAPPAVAPTKSRRRPPRGAPRARSDTGSRFSVSPLLMGAAIGEILVVALFVGRRLLSRGGDETAPPADDQSIADLDQDRINELIVASQQDHGNTELGFEIGESCFQANQWEKAIEWFSRLVELDPTNVHAYTDIGTSSFNLGLLAEAKAAWLTGLQIEPDDQQLNCNMGFFYASTEPQDLEAADATATSEATP